MTMTDPHQHQIWFDADHHLVHTVQWQPRAADPDAEPVLLVHGLGGSTVNWDLVGQPLADRVGATVTALDLPGFGRTRSDHRRAGFDDHRQVVTAYLAEHGPAIVAGNSMGGALAVAVAAEHPELATGVVLVNAAYPRPSGNLDQVARTIKFATLTLPRATIRQSAIRAVPRKIHRQRTVSSFIPMFNPIGKSLSTTTMNQKHGWEWSLPLWFSVVSKNLGWFTFVVFTLIINFLDTIFGLTPNRLDF